MRRFVQRNGPVVRVERSEIPSPPIHGCSTRTLLPSIRTTILRRSARSWLERADQDPVGRGRTSPSIGVGAQLLCASQQIQGADVAFGSETALWARDGRVCLTPNRDHVGAGTKRCLVQNLPHLTGRAPVGWLRANGSASLYCIQVSSSYSARRIFISSPTP
jgi:hypothetical protein